MDAHMASPEYNESRRPVAALQVVRAAPKLSAILEHDLCTESLRGASQPWDCFRKSRSAGTGTLLQGLAAIFRE
jgi:hypothetical protein